MADMNVVVLAGRLTRDPELRYTNGGTAVCNFCIAINRRFKNREGAVKDEATFVDIECWGRQAENAAEYLKVGSGVLIQGRLKLEQWESKQTGEKRSRMRVVADRTIFLSGKPAGEKESA